MIEPKFQDIPVLTNDLARQIESSHAEFAVERLQGIADQTGNPFGIEVSRTASCVALFAAHLPPAWMNTIHLVGEADIDWISECVARYRAFGKKARLEVLPCDLTPTLAKKLDSLELFQQEFQAALYGFPTNLAIRPNREIDIRRVDENSFEVFLDTFLSGFQAPPISKGNMRHWIERPNWRLYLAEVDGQPAGAGVLVVNGKTGYLAAGATLPQFRGQGYQSALITRRLKDAQELGCELITGQCNFASTSHRNMQRAGLQLAYIKAVWTER